ncbi:MAG: glycosyltransferase family 87 protein [Candidatus Sumerlaeaceae bacterium]|jgi:hypothetical protein
MMNKRQLSNSSPIRIEPLLFLCLTGLALAQLSYYFLIVPFGMHGVDFTVLWRAAHQFFHGEPVYLPPSLLIGRDHWEVFKYPQFLAMCTAWLALFPLEEAEIVWKLLMLGCIAATAWISGALVHQNDEAAELSCCVISRRVAITGILASLSLFSPLAWSLELGQVGPLLVLALTLAFSSQKHEKHHAEGVWLVLASLVKIQPVLLFLTHVLWKRWRPPFVALGLTALYLVLLSVLGRLRDEMYYFAHIVTQIPHLAHIVSFSLFRALTEFLHIKPESSPQAYRAALLAYEMLAGGGYLALLFTLKHCGCTFGSTWLVGLVALPLVSPVLEGHHYVILWPAWLAHYLLAQAGKISRVLTIALLLSWLPIFQASSFHRHTTLHALGYIPTLANLTLVAGSVALALGLRQSKKSP